MSELRKDPVTSRWVIISQERGKRPLQDEKPVQKEDSKSCPFCEGNEKLTPGEIYVVGKIGRHKNSTGWNVRVIPNKFPALRVEGELHAHGENMYDKMNGIGAHEVIIESPEHTKNGVLLPVEQYKNILLTYAERINDLKNDLRIEYILVFKNHGASAGATLNHPHSQLIATPIVPKKVLEELSGAKKYFEFKGRCVFCDMISTELESASRVVYENDNFIAFCPFASRFPFEVWILPKLHDSVYENINEKEASELAKALRTVLGKLNEALSNPDYNYILHNWPHKNNDGNSAFHWHIEIIPKLTKVAGFEWGSGFYINPTSPEDAAKYLRESF